VIGLILLVVFVLFIFSRGGLNITEPEVDGLRPDRDQAEAIVTKVYDGDTIKVKLRNGGKATVRILGIDCPETTINEKCRKDRKRGWLSCEEQIPLGKRAKRQALDRLLGETVTLRSGTDNGFKKGSYGRGLAYVHESNGRDFGFRMVRKGFCRDFSNVFEHPRMRSYRNQQYKGTDSRIKPLNNQ